MNPSLTSVFAFIHFNNETFLSIGAFSLLSQVVIKPTYFQSALEISKNTQLKNGRKLTKRNPRYNPLEDTGDITEINASYQPQANLLSKSVKTISNQFIISLCRCFSSFSCDPATSLLRHGQSTIRQLRCDRFYHRSRSISRVRYNRYEHSFAESRSCVKSEKFFRSELR